MYASTHPHITLREFKPQDQAQVQALILSGLSEHLGSLDPDYNLDINDIANTYADGVFLLALHMDQLIGTGGFLPLNQRVVQISRMSVTKPYRRQGIGRLILSALCERAQAAGFREVILETTSNWTEVVAFYKAFGFEVTYQKDGDTYFRLTLDN